MALSCTFKETDGWSKTGKTYKRVLMESILDEFTALIIVVISKVIQSTIHVVQFSNYVVSKLKYCSARALGDNRNKISLFTYFF